MKVLIDLIWGGLMILACSLIVAAIIYHNGQYVSYAVLVGGIAALITMSEQYHIRRRRDFHDKFKR